MSTSRWRPPPRIARTDARFVVHLRRIGDFGVIVGVDAHCVRRSGIGTGTPRRHLFDAVRRFIGILSRCRIDTGRAHSLIFDTAHRMSSSLSAPDASRSAAALSI